MLFGCPAPFYSATFSGYLVTEQSEQQVSILQFGMELMELKYQQRCVDIVAQFSPGKATMRKGDVR